MNEQRRSTSYEHNPVYGTRPLIFHEQGAAQQERAEQEQISQAASRELAARDMALIRALNPPRLPDLGPPPLREPTLPANFESQAADLDREIVKRGIAVSRDKLMALGQERFAELLARDHDVRSYQRVLFGDLTAWPAVAHSFATVDALRTNLPPRRISEQLSGQGADREAAARIDGWKDLWKAAQVPESVRRVYEFHDCFARLSFGQSMRDRLSPDGRVHSRWFAGGSGIKVRLFQDWLSVLEGPHFKVVISQPLFSVLAWLCDEQASPPDLAQLATDWTGQRSPSDAQVRLSEAVLHGFLLDYRSWALWDFVGRRTRQTIDVGALEIWHKSLISRYPAIHRFHQDLRSFFFKPARADGYHEFDTRRHSLFVDEATQNLLGILSLLTALAVEDTALDATVARFQDGWLLAQGKPRRTLGESVEHKLTGAFPGARFSVNVEMVP
jgi:hypothetical protein